MVFLGVGCWDHERRMVRLLPVTSAPNRVRLCSPHPLGNRIPGGSNSWNLSASRSGPPPRSGIRHLIPRPANRGRLAWSTSDSENRTAGTVRHYQTSSAFFPILGKPSSLCYASPTAWVRTLGGLLRGAVHFLGSDRGDFVP